MSVQGKILVTGATGFLGRSVAARMAGEGFRVSALVRDPGRAVDSVPPGTEIYRCDLPDFIDGAAFTGDVQAIIHCAYDTSGGTGEAAARVNIEGTARLIEACRLTSGSPPHFVLVSSLAAHDEARSFYGRSKLEAEARVRESALPWAIVRPGTIIGDGGVFARTRQMVRTAPALPVFYAGARRLQTVWVGDLCEAITRIVNLRQEGEFNLADEGVTVREYYEGLCQLEGVKKPMPSVPGDVFLPALKMTEALGLKLPITSENLLGLKKLKYVDATESWRHLGLTPKTFAQSLYALTAS